MSISGDFVSILNTRDTPEYKTIMDATPSGIAQQMISRHLYFSEEDRYEHMYREFKQAVNDSYIPDQELEDDFFGRRQLSIGDIDGTRTIVTATPESRILETSNHSSDTNTSQIATSEDHHAHLSNDGLFTFIHNNKSEKISIVNLGNVDQHVQIENNETRRTYASSVSASYCGYPTPELDSDDDDNLTVDTDGNDLGYDATSDTFHHFTQADVRPSRYEAQNDPFAAQSTSLSGSGLGYDRFTKEEENSIDIESFGYDHLFEHFFNDDKACDTDANLKTQVAMTPIKRENDDSDQLFVLSWFSGLANPVSCSDHDAPVPVNTTFDVSLNELDGDTKLIASLAETKSAPIPRLSKAPFLDSSLLKRRAHADSVNSPQALKRLLPHQGYAQYTKENDACPPFDIATPKIVGREIPSTRIVKTPTFSEVLNVKKRSARESFDLIELCDENTYHESANKRRRLTPTAAEETCSITPTTSTSTSSVMYRSPMATALQGYDGQFQLHRTDDLSPLKKSSDQHVFGNHLHANGEIINLHFVADSSAHGSDLSDAGDLNTTLQYASLFHSIAEQTSRTPEEEELRKETHRECAAARLESVSVGYYRYFAGHMTVEEYVEANMCVCWDRCVCSKLCTRFGDLICPCSENLVVAEDI